MGNCFGLCEITSGCRRVGDRAMVNKVVKVAKQDGKILEFSSPILVKHVLTNFSALGIGASKEASEFLSPDYELKAGRLYYLLGSLPCSSSVSSIGNTKASSKTKRVKVVITKKQFEQLVSKQICIQDILSFSKVHHQTSSDLPSSWRPKLDSIPEGNE